MFVSLMKKSGFEKKSLLKFCANHILMFLIRWWKDEDLKSFMKFGWHIRFISQNVVLKFFELTINIHWGIWQLWHMHTYNVHPCLESFQSSDWFFSVKFVLQGSRRWEMVDFWKTIKMNLQNSSVWKTPL